MPSRFSFSSAVWWQVYAKRGPEKKVLIYMNMEKKKSSTRKCLIKEEVHLCTFWSSFCNTKIPEKKKIFPFWNLMSSAHKQKNSNLMQCFSVSKYWKPTLITMNVCQMRKSSSTQRRKEHSSELSIANLRAEKPG